MFKSEIKTLFHQEQLIHTLGNFQFEPKNKDIIFRCANENRVIWFDRQLAVERSSAVGTGQPR